MENIKFYNSIIKLSNTYIKLVYNPVIIGRDNIDDNKTYLFAGNHTNWKDPALVIYGVDGNLINFMAKKELFDNKLLNPIVTRLGAFPIDRENGDMKAVKTAVNLLKNDHNVGIFPEGKRNNSLGDFKSGVPRIALMGNKEIIPFGISGEYKHNGNLTLVFGKPINFKGIKKNEADEILKEEVKSLILK